MFKPLKILDEKHKVLRKHSAEVKLPLSKEDKDTIEQIIKHLRYSQIEKYAEKYTIIDAKEMGVNQRCGGESSPCRR